LRRRGGGMDSTDLAQDKEQWRALVNMLMFRDWQLFIQKQMLRQHNLKLVYLVHFSYLFFNHLAIFTDSGMM
jgi:hypothetical protein